MKPVITKELLDKLKSPKGGFTRASLEALGIGWPPPRGWHKQLMREAEANAVKDKIEGVESRPKLGVSEKWPDFIKRGFLMLQPEQRVELIHSLKCIYCFSCGRMLDGTPCSCD